MPESYRYFDHGYAVTAHRSQGKSVDAVVISSDAMKRELFYVAASRGRDNVTIVTSDKDVLRQSIGRSGERQSASELVRKTGQNELQTRRIGLQRGVHRGPSAARERARRAAGQERERGIKIPGKGRNIKRDTPTRDRQVERGREHGFGR